MKKLMSRFTNIILIVFLQLLLSCDSSTDPYLVLTSGVRGTVKDIQGKPIQDVQVYCLYYKYSLPIDLYKQNEQYKVVNTSDVKFELEQNFPNPFFNSTFVRYSLPSKSEIKLSITNPLDNKTVYKQEGTRNAGYYQFYLQNFVDSLNLSNGSYDVTLTAFSEKDTIYVDKKTLFIISDLGKPSSSTNLNGQYSFESAQTFEGDSVLVREKGGYNDIYFLSNKVNLLFKKKGYNSKMLNVTIYEDVILENDVVLIKEQ